VENIKKMERNDNMKTMGENLTSFKKINIEGTNTNKIIPKQPRSHETS